MPSSLIDWVYDKALVTPFTGDESKFPDCLAYRWPVEDDVVMLQILNFDSDLVTLVEQVLASTEDDNDGIQARGNTLTAVLEEQHARRQRLPTAGISCE